jgi:hypothetical protein
LIFIKNFVIIIIENKKKRKEKVIIMSEKRVFKKDYLGELKVLAEDAGRKDLVDFCEKEIEKLTNRKTSQTKNQKENEGIKETILEVLAGLDEPVTITDFLKADERVAEYSNQKVSALMKQLVDTGKVVKTIDKKRSYFAIAD